MGTFTQKVVSHGTSSILSQEQVERLIFQRGKEMLKVLLTLLEQNKVSNLYQKTFRDTQS